jgi:glycyl-tRNA synthetase beta chain
MGFADRNIRKPADIKGKTVAVTPGDSMSQIWPLFLKKTGLTREQLEERDGVLFAKIDRPGRGASEVLAEAIESIVRNFPWPKSMRWGGGSLRWVRPLHGIVALLGEEIVPVEVDSVASGAVKLQAAPAGVEVHV